MRVGTQNCCVGMRRAQEHTANISLMSVTLDVSRLSDWLNPLVDLNIACIFVTLDVSSVSGWLKARVPLNMLFISVTLDVLSISGWLKAINPPPMTVQYSLLNMLAMCVTLDVSKVSDWLKASAFCRVARWAYTRRGEVRAGR